MINFIAHKETIIFHGYKKNKKRNNKQNRYKEEKKIIKRFISSWSVKLHIRSATLSFALRERGLLLISFFSGEIGFRFTTLSVGIVLHMHFGYSLGHTQEIAF